MRRPMLLVSILAVSALSACGSSSGPTPSFVQAAGTWTVTFGPLAVSGLGDCTLTDMSLDIVQDGVTLTGTHGSTDVSCPLQPTYTYPAGNINGTASATNIVVTIQSGADQKVLTAAVHGDSMSGGAHWVEGGVLGNGPLTAVKQ